MLQYDVNDTMIHWLDVIIKCHFSDAMIRDVSLVRVIKNIQPPFRAKIVDISAYISKSHLTIGNLAIIRFMGV